MQTNEEFMSGLIHKAEFGEHRQFQFLRSCQEYLRARKVKRAEKLLVDSIEKSADKLFKKYCRDITTGEADVIKLLAYCSTIKVLRFYEEELRIISDMVDEYEYYLAYGNWTDFLFGLQRPIDKLWDYRG